MPKHDTPLNESTPELPPLTWYLLSGRWDLQQDIRVKLLDAVKASPTLAFDVETTGLDPYQHELLGVGFHILPDLAFYVGWHNCWSQQADYGAARQFIEEVFKACPNHIAQNAYFDTEWINVKLGIDVLPLAGDTRVEGSFIDENLPNGLKERARRHLNAPDWDKLWVDEEGVPLSDYTSGKKSIVTWYCPTCYSVVEATQKSKTVWVCPVCTGKCKRQVRKATLEDAPREETSRYCCYDAYYTTHLHEYYLANMTTKQRRLYDSLSVSQMTQLARMSQRGVDVDREALQELGIKLDARVAELYTQVQELSGLGNVVFTKGAEAGLNLSSTQQKSYLLYDYLGLGGIIPDNDDFRTESGAMSVSAATMKYLLDYERLPEDARQIVSTILDYGKLSKLKTAFVDNWMSLSERDGKLHPEYLMSGTVTGRLSCKTPNLQQIPKSMRPFFVPPEGYSIIENDYCLRFDAKVMLWNGKCKEIRKMVKEKDPGPVVSIDENGNLVPGVVTNWFRNERKGRPLLTLDNDWRKGNRDTKKSHGNITVTSDHNILTERGYIPASDLLETDKVATGTSCLKGNALSAFVGSMLGDGHLNYHTGVFEIGHAIAQDEFTFLLGNLFSPVMSGHDTRPNTAKGGGPFTRIWSSPIPFFKHQYPIWYNGHRKKDQLPREYLKENLDEMAIAILYMDDGTLGQLKPHHRPFGRIFTFEYTKEDVEFLAQLFRDLGFPCHVIPTQKHWSLAFDVVEFATLRTRIAKYVPSCMRYKLGVGGELDDFDPTLYNPSTDMYPVLFLPTKVYEAKPRICYTCNPPDFIQPENFVYCLEVDKYHNFSTLGGVVSNCALEIRVWAHLSNDPTLKKVIQEQPDFHSWVASQIFSKPIEDINSLDRVIAKCCAFGSILYGGGVHTLTKKTGISHEEGTSILKEFHDLFHVGTFWMEQVKRFCRGHKYVETFFGRRRRLPNIVNDDNSLRSEAERQAVNTCVQGTGADITNLAGLRVEKAWQEAGLDAHPVIFVHDSIVAVCREDQAEEANQIMQEKMTVPPVKSWSVPLAVEGSISKRWGGELNLDEIVYGKKEEQEVEVDEQ